MVERLLATRKRVLVLFPTEAVLDLILLFLFPNVFLYGCSIDPYCTYVISRCPEIHVSVLVLQFACRSKIIIALFPLRYPMIWETLYLGGTLTSRWMWSGIICPSMISIPFHLHRSRMICWISFRNWLYIVFLRYFGVNTIWYLHTYFVCAKLFAMENILSLCILVAWTLTIILERMFSCLSFNLARIAGGSWMSSSRVHSLAKA